MSTVERVSADTREELRGGVIFEEATTRNGTVEREQRGSGYSGEDPGINSGLDPAKVLDTKLGSSSISFVVKNGGFRAEIEEGDAALAITDGEEEVVERIRGEKQRIRGEELVGKRLRGPADGGDEGGEGRSSGGSSSGRRRERNCGDQLHRMGIHNGHRAAGGVSKETGGR